MYAYRAACTYGRVLTVRPVTTLTSSIAPLVCTRGFAKAKAKDAKTEPKEKKPRVKKVKTPVDINLPRLHRKLNEKPESTTPSITRVELQELLKKREKIVLVDLRTDAEILLAGDALIASANRMPIQPLTHLDTYKPPKVKVDKTAKGKKSKKNPKQQAKTAKQEPAKVDPLSK